MSTLRHCHSIKSGKGLVAAGFLALVTLGVPAKLFVDHVRHYDQRTQQEEESLGNTFKWIARNTPTDSTVVLPPWRKDSFYLSQRAQIANWWVVRFDRLTEWRERLESLAGDLSNVTDGTEKANMMLTTHHYNHLTATDIASLMEKYGAAYLVSSARYSYPVLFNSGIYKVYSLKGDGHSG